MFDEKYRHTASTWGDDNAPDRLLMVSQVSSPELGGRLTLTMRDTARNEDIWEGTLDDLSVILEEWSERHQPDPGPQAPKHILQGAGVGQRYEGEDD